MKTVKQLEKEVNKFLKDFKNGTTVLARKINKPITKGEIEKKFPYLYKLSKTK